MYNAPQVKQALVEAIELGAREITVDLTATTFIDSTTLGILLGAQRRLRESKGQITIAASDRTILKVFEITGRCSSTQESRTINARPVSGSSRFRKAAGDSTSTISSVGHTRASSRCPPCALPSAFPTTTCACT